VTRYFRRDDGLIDYEVRFPNGSVADISEVELHVRPWNAPDDPAESARRRRRGKPIPSFTTGVMPAHMESRKTTGKLLLVP
jgi:hypothetical protein